MLQTMDDPGHGSLGPRPAAWWGSFSWVSLKTSLKCDLCTIWSCLHEVGSNLNTYLVVKSGGSSSDRVKRFTSGCGSFCLWKKLKMIPKEKVGEGANMNLFIHCAENNILLDTQWFTLFCKRRVFPKFWLSCQYLETAHRFTCSSACSVQRCCKG